MSPTTPTISGERLIRPLHEDPAANHPAVREISPGKRLVDDQDARAGAAVSPVEWPPVHDQVFPSRQSILG